MEVEAMVLGGLRRCEVLGLRLEDINVGEKRLFIAEGKGGRQRIVPISARFFASLGRYLEEEHPRTSATDRVFVVLKGPRRGRPLSAAVLGNGYCARPVGLDCHVESICESCTFFQTTIEFRPTLERQRDDVAAKGQVGRQRIFDGLIARLDEAS